MDTKESAPESSRFFENKDIFWAGVVFFISYAFYIFSAYPTITSEDSGEFTAAVFDLGIAHPSGYPLYVILGKIFTLLIPFGNIGWRVNLFSAFMAAATVSAVYLFLKLITKDRAIGIITALVFASGPLFWSQAIRAEVYSLNSFLLIFIITLAYVWFLQVQLNKKEQNKTLLWLSFLYGLSLTNHQLMLMAGFPLAFFVIYVQPRIFFNYRLLAKALLLFAVGLSLYLFLPLRASYQPAINWGNPVTSESFWNHVTRKVYYADALSPSYELVFHQKTGSNNILGDFFQYHVGEFFRRFAVILDDNYSWITLIFVALGLVFLWKRSRKIFWLFVMLIIFYGPIFSALIGLGFTDKLPMNFFIDRPFYLPLLLIALLLAGMGIRYLTSLVALAGRTTAPASVRKKSVAALALVATIILAYRFPAQNQSGNYLVYDVAKAYLSLLPASAVVHSENGDNTTFPIMYLQKVENFRPDVTVYLNMPTNIYRYFKDLPTMESENPGKRIFTDFPFVQYSNKTYNYLGPVSEILPLTDSTQQKAKIPTDENYENLNPRGIQNSNLDHFHQYVKARYYLDRGLSMGSDSLRQDALFTKAFESAPESSNITGQLIGNYYVRSNAFQKAVTYLEAAQKLMPNEYPLIFQLTFCYIVTDQAAKAEEFIATITPENRELLMKEFGLFAQQQGEKYPLLDTFVQKTSR